MSRALQSRSLADNIPDRADMEPEPAGQGQVWVRSAGMGTGAVGQSDGIHFFLSFFVQAYGQYALNLKAR